GELEASVQTLLRAVRESHGKDLGTGLFLEAVTKTIRGLLRLKREPEALDLARVLDGETAAWAKDRDGGPINAYRELFRSRVFIADGAQEGGASPVPWFDRALEALSRWREA